MTPPPTTDCTGFIGATAPPLAARSRLTTSARTPLPTAVPASTQAVGIRLPTLSAPTLSTQLLPQRLSNPFSAPPSAAGTSGTTIVLFRSDLRLDDHVALSKALENSSTILPVFCFDPRHFGRTEHGFDKTGKYRARFLIEGVHNLRQNLRKLGADLIVRHGRPEDIVPDLAASVGASRVHLHREVTFEEQEVEEGLKKVLQPRGVEVHTFWSNTLYHCDDLPFDLSHMPDVYSDFREAVEQSSRIRAPLPAPKELAAVPQHVQPGDIPTLSELGISEVGVSQSHAHGVCAVTGGEDEALTRVRAYVKDARTQSHSPNDRSSEHLGADFSCRISPWLALGCVSPRRIFQDLCDQGGSSVTFLRSSTYLELVWRDFFRCITAKYSERRAASASRSVSKAPSKLAVGAF